ncbi:MAG: pentapeptide repeat-containing protein [Cyanobacteria bacterium J06621_11]
MLNGPILWPDGLGFGGQKSDPPKKTLWDWLSLLGVPLSLALLGAWLQTFQKQQAIKESQEEILQDFLDRTSTILIDKNVIGLATQEKKTLENQALLNTTTEVIRARTLSNIRRFDSRRDHKTSVVRFLLETQIISKLKLNLSGVDMRRTQLSETNFNGVDLSRSLLNKANLSKSHLKGTTLIQANFTGANLSNTNLSRANLSKATLNDVNLSHAILKETNLTDAVLRRANLNGADLSEANLSEAILNHASLNKVVLRGAKINSAELIHVNLNSANLTRADLSPTEFRYRLSSTESIFQVAKSPFIGANLSGANLSNANLSGANLSNVNLSGANLSNANLSGANLSGANLSNTNLSGTKLSRVNLYMSVLRNVKFNNSTRWPSRKILREAKTVSWLLKKKLRL